MRLARAILIRPLLLWIACLAPFQVAHSQECVTPGSIEEINRGIPFDRVAHVEGNLAKVFIALDPVWSTPDFDDIPYRNPDDMRRLRDGYQALMQADIDEIVVWRVRQTMGAAIPFANGCVVDGYGDLDDIDKLEDMHDVVRLISDHGIDHASVRRGIKRVLEPMLERYGLPALTSNASYEEKIDKIIEKILPILASSTAERASDDSLIDALEISAYDAIIVGEFRDNATENARLSGDTPQERAEARETYQADLAIALTNFRELLIQELQRTNAFAEVVPEGTTPTGRALLVDGEITQFDRGNLTARLLIGMGAGRVRFDVIVRVKDASSGTEIVSFDMGRGSGLIGGAIGTVITVEYYMQRSAAKVASEVLRERCAAIVCEGPAALTIAASEDTDRAAKDFDVPANECWAYFYISLPRNSDDRRGVDVWLNDADAGVMDSESGYFLWSLEPGEYVVATRYLSERLKRSIEVECMGGEAIFLHHEVSGPMIERLITEPSKQGQRDVRRRQLLLALLDD